MVYRPCLRPVSYLRFPSRVPTVPLTPFRTEAPPVYQPCPSPRSVPQKPLPCTNRVLHPVPYLRSPSRVPTMPLIPFRTSEAPPVYQPCPSPRSVPQKPLRVPTIPFLQIRTSVSLSVYQLDLSVGSSACFAHFVVLNKALSGNKRV